MNEYELIVKDAENMIADKEKFAGTCLAILLEMKNCDLKAAIPLALKFLIETKGDFDKK